MKRDIIFRALALSLASIPTARAISAYPEPFTVQTTDGSEVTIRAEGDENGFLLISDEGYVVMEEEGAQYRYAIPADIGGISSGFESAEGGSPRVKPEDYRKKLKENCFKAFCGGIPDPSTAENECQGDDCGTVGGVRRRTKQVGPEIDDNRNQTTSPIGIVPNLVVLIEFQDNWNTLPSTEAIDILMNSEEKTSIIPTGSLKGVYRDISFGRLTIESTVTEWIKVSKRERFYSGDVTVSTNLHDALREALDYLDDNNIIDFSEYDSDGDGYIDAITFLHSGYAAEWGRPDCGGIPSFDRIWSHKWKLWSDSTGEHIGPWESKNGVKVWQYHIGPALWGTCGSEIGRVGVIAHETGHFFGMHDLYDINGGGKGLGYWCMMSNSWGWDRSQYFPGHMSAYGAVKLGWVEPQTPVEGINIIAALETSSTLPKVYKIGDGQFGYPEGEYLLIENRQNIGLDSMLPQTGIAIYHVDEKAGFDEGYPEQPGWPMNGKHYKVAMLQADGKFELEQSLNAGSYGDMYSANAGYTSLSPSENDPSQGPFPNTDSYQRGVLKKTGVEIYDISDSSEVMTFFFTSPAPETNPAPTTAPIPAPTTSPTPAPTTAPTLPRSPTQSPTLPPMKSPTRSPTQSSTNTPSPTGLPTLPSTGLPASSPTEFPTQPPTQRPTRGDDDWFTDDDGVTDNEGWFFGDGGFTDDDGVPNDDGVTDNEDSLLADGGEFTDDDGGSFFEVDADYDYEEDFGYNDWIDSWFGGA